MLLESKIIDARSEQTSRKVLKYGPIRFLRRSVWILKKEIILPQSLNLAN